MFSNTILYTYREHTILKKPSNIFSLDPAQIQKIFVYLVYNRVATPQAVGNSLQFPKLLKQGCVCGGIGVRGAPCKLCWHD